MWFKKCGFYAYGINVQNCDVRRCHQQVLDKARNHMPRFELNNNKELSSLIRVYPVTYEDQRSDEI